MLNTNMLQSCQIANLTLQSMREAAHWNLPIEKEPPDMEQLLVALIPSERDRNALTECNQLQLRVTSQRDGILVDSLDSLVDHGDPSDSDILELWGELDDTVALIATFSLTNPTRMSNEFADEARSGSAIDDEMFKVISGNEG